MTGVLFTNRLKLSDLLFISALAAFINAQVVTNHDPPPVRHTIVARQTGVETINLPGEMTKYVTVFAGKTEFMNQHPARIKVLCEGTPYHAAFNYKVRLYRDGVLFDSLYPGVENNRTLPAGGHIYRAEVSSVVTTEAHGSSGIQEVTLILEYPSKRRPFWVLMALCLGFLAAGGIAQAHERRK